MNKYMITLSLLLISIPVYATCSIENNETRCSIANYREKFSPTFNTQNNMKVKEFSSSPTTKLQPIKRDNIKENMENFTSSENNSSYNSSCQFGICLQNRSTPIFQRPKQ